MSLALRFTPRALLLLMLAGAGGVSAQGRVGGRVLDAKNLAPLPSVQVHIPGTTIGTLTGNDGRYLLPNVPAGAHQIRAERIGYKTDSRGINVRAGELTTADFTIGEEALALDALLVTGTAGSARRREIGNSISQINVSNVAEPVRGVESLLQGRVAGVNVNMASSTMGAGAAIRLRGNVSVSMSNQPLVYVDGVRQTADAYPRNQSLGGSTFSGSQTQSSPLNDINPADIERIEIVKGAAAATLYGTDAAAGVIQIFTKKGAIGKPLWTYQTDQGFVYQRPYGSDVRPLLQMDPFLKKGWGQKHSGSVSGGNDGTQYFMSGNFEDRDGVLPNDHERRYGVRGNFSFRPASTLTVDFNSFLTNDDLSVSPNGNGNESIFFAVYRAPGNALGTSDPEKLKALLNVDNLQTNNRLIMGGTARWLPFEHLSNRFTIGYDQATSSQSVFHPYGYPIFPAGDVSSVEFKSKTTTFDYVGSYDFGLRPDLRSTFSLGGQLIRTAATRLDAFGSGLPGPGKQTVSVAAQRVAFENDSSVNTGGFFLQDLMAFKDRYFVTAGVRIDGNSAFGKNFGLQAYPKVNGSWVVSDESFWNKSLGQLKVRAALGLAGRAPGAFDAIRTWTASSFGGNTAFITRNLGNPDLAPETTREYEVGFESSLLQDRLTIDLTYYNQKTRHALLLVRQPPSLGFLNQQLQNVGEIGNKGLEVAVNGTVLRTHGVTWELGLNGSLNKSIAFTTGSAVLTTVVAGQPVPVVRGAKVTNQNDFNDPAYQLNSAGQIDNAFFGPNQPTKILQALTTLRLPHTLTLSVRGEYQGGHWVSDFPSTLVAQRGPQGAVGCDNVYKIVPWAEYDGPTGVNGRNTHPNLGKVRALDRARCYKLSRSDIWQMPADFFKLREITAQMQLPFAIPRIKTAYLTVSGRNLWRWVNSEFASFDPEIISAREQITALTFGISDQLPPSSSFTASLRFTF